MVLTAVVLVFRFHHAVLQVSYTIRPPHTAEGMLNAPATVGNETLSLYLGQTLSIKLCRHVLCS